MDDGKGTANTNAGGGKAVLPVPVPVPAGSDGDAGAATTSSARVALQTTSLPAAGAGSGGEEDGADDEKVERFYALLDNIRAMRGAYGVETGGGRAWSKKRLRGSEPPWRPAFRLEDFEEPSTTSSDAAPRAKRAHRLEADGGEGGAARPAAGSPSAAEKAFDVTSRHASGM